MCYKPVYILIIFLTVSIDFIAAKNIEKSKNIRQRKMHLWLGIINTCTILFIFKYHNFLIDNLHWLGFKSASYWNILLPIGLSFHVFQSLSYVIEVYRGKLKAEHNLLVYANYVMMFPQLVSGPIERAGNLLPQIRNVNHEISYEDFSIGFSRVVWGLLKKVVVADSLGMYVDAVYDNYTHHCGSTLCCATIFFAFRIYCDFSGYSDMAIGLARMLGFRFKENFALPYFSKSITDFWRRWHISLSTWLRDYIYFSLGGNRKGKFKTFRNLMLTMLIGGLWHGASWNFVIWGGLNGIFLCMEKAVGFTRTVFRNIFMKVLQMIYVFILISFTWIFFRAATFEQAISIVKKIFTNFNLSDFQILDNNVFGASVAALIILLFTEIFVLRKYNFEDLFCARYSKVFLPVFSILCVFYIILMGNANGSLFIYFQF
ncbi:MBOAT family O-acyltransferase [Arachidicoccus ginsenosidimutans]|uniref:MBOAT family O-acyltransferase n=1 Tax=Arachidicoccus sp. BS20 TaxID=1850526 RepID=UPI0018D29C8D|nr:MBOAT family protein [Arachidicoccus sp. BS20]